MLNFIVCKPVLIANILQHLKRVWSKRMAVFPKNLGKIVEESCPTKTQT
jgi:hypothetical protein